MRQRLLAVLRRTRTWVLLRTLFPWQEDLPPGNEAVLASREMLSSPILLRIASWVARVPSLMVAVLAVLYLWALVSSRSSGTPIYCSGLILFVPLLWLVPSLLAWALPIGLAVGPLIAREREHQTWEILRATPSGSEEILVRKTQGGLLSLRHYLRPLWHVQLQVLFTILFGVTAMFLLAGNSTLSRGRATPLAYNLPCLGLIGLFLAVVSAYLFDRIQQFALMAGAALAASASSPTVRAASVAAIAASFLTWGVELMIGLIVLLLQPAGQVQDVGFTVATMVILGPLAGYLIELSPRTIVLAAALTWLLRDLALRLLWRTAVRRAEKI